MAQPCGREMEFAQATVTNQFNPSGRVRPHGQQLSYQDVAFARGAAIGLIDAQGVAISFEQFRANCQRKGLCITCGRIKTHTKKTGLKGFYMAPVTRNGEVYDGYCLKCHTLQEVLNKPEMRAKLEKKPSKNLNRSKSRGSTGSNQTNAGTRLGKQTSSLSLGDSSTGTERSQTDIIEFMMDNSRDPVAQAHGCADLSDVTFQHPNFLTAAIDAIIDAMNNHPNDDRVQMEGCKAFRKFSTEGSKHSLCSAGDEIKVNPDSCNRIWYQGGIFAIICALQLHSNYGIVQREGIRSLRNVLCTFPDSRNPIVDANGIELIIRAMKIHTNLSSVQEDGCAILWSLAQEHVGRQSIFEKNDGVQAILNAMKLNRRQETTQYHGCGALHTLSFNEDLKSIMLDSGGVPVIIRALRRYAHSEIVCAHACLALSALVISAGSCVSARDMHSVTEDGEIDISLKYNLFEMGEDEIEAVLTAMKNHSESSRVQQAACQVFNIASRTQSNLILMRKTTNLYGLLSDAKEIFPKECREHALFVMSAMEGYYI